MTIRFAVALALLLAGCSGGRKMMMERSPDYEAGYADGCSSAAASGPGIPRTPKRNEMVYAANPDYRRGWNSGSVQCRIQGPNRL